MDLLISLIPAVLMIVLVIATRKVITSISAGIIAGALIAFDFNVVEAGKFIYETLWGIVTDFSWYMPIVGFVLLLGVIAANMTIAGSTKAFADFAVSKIKNEKAAQYLAWILGIVIFIDDYFNALVIGEISKPITDRYKVSRAKLAYIIDSTSAPVVILLPLSTWGAYIIGTLDSIFTDVNYTAHSGIQAFWGMVPMQFYAISALIMVFLVVRFNMNIGSMKTYEESAQNGEDASKSYSAEELTDVAVESDNGSKWALIVTVLSLIFSILFGMLYKADFVFANMLGVDITVPLFVAAVVATVVSFIYAILDDEVKHIHLFHSTRLGLQSMLPAAIILILAWTLVEVVGTLGTGDLLADFIVSSNINVNYLPAILFIIGGFIAFMTGTSWGTFGLLLPITGTILAAAHPEGMLVAMAAVLSGAILGDHCSPISDTTVLSATGAQSTLDAHFTSQLPYAMISGLIALVGYTVYGLSQNLLVSYAVMAVALTGVVLLLKRK